MREQGSIAYFSMEIGINPKMPTYSGGLGVLAGDTIRAAADMKLPFVAVTLISSKGYFRQVINDDGVQRENPEEWDPSSLMKLQKPTVKVTIEKREVSVRAWKYDYQSPFGGEVPVIFLDTDFPDNSPEDRKITQHLYGGEETYRLKSEIVLGIGGLRVLDSLGFQVIKYHLNEGHAALLTLELLQRTKRSIENVWDEKSIWDFNAVRTRTIFTTHTPVAAGHDQFPYDMVGSVLGEYIPFDIFKELAGRDLMNNTLLAMNLSGYINGVAKKHKEVSRSMFKGYTIASVTNGVHSVTWTHENFRQIYDRYIPGWREDPNLLAWVEKIPDYELWNAHCKAKKELLDYIKESSGKELREDILTIGFARRATGYKRPDLIFNNLDELIRIGRGRLQLVFAGKAHPRDQAGKDLIKAVTTRIMELKGTIDAVYLPDYNISMAMLLIPGVDLWLNNPLRPREASGTSGMKAAHNGVPNLSVLDGWWIEGHIEDLTGWSIGSDPKSHPKCERDIVDAEDAADLYRKIEEKIMPLYYGDRQGWIRIMKGAIGKNAYYFNAHRMMRRYVTEAYIRNL